jgi:hypothetical protein
MAVTRRELDQKRRQVLRQAVPVGRVVGVQHLGDAGQLRRLFGHASTAFAGDQQVDLGADLGGGGHRVQGGRLEFAVVVLGDDQGAHA